MSKAKQFSKPDMPLTPPIFYILLALSTKERHGYDIMKQVLVDSQQKVKLGPGTLYGAIKRMLEDRLVIELSRDENARRRYYKLTEKGKKMLDSELQRFAVALELAKSRKIFATPISVRLAFAYV